MLLYLTIAALLVLLCLTFCFVRHAWGKAFGKESLPDRRDAFLAEYLSFLTLDDATAMVDAICDWQRRVRDDADENQALYADLDHPISQWVEIWYCEDAYLRAARLSMWQHRARQAVARSALMVDVQAVKGLWRPALQKV